MTISNSVNTGNINGNDIGGFLGFIATLSDSSLSTLSILNSVNKGNVSAEKGLACGMFYVSPDSADSLNTTVLNSINKGGVNGTTSAYGITNIITKARNVVSMGEVTGPSGSFTFWNTSTDVDLFFGLDGKCVNCSDGTTLFVHNTNTGFYEVFESGEHVHDLLNAEVEKQNFGMFWTEELDLVYPYVEPSSSSSPSMVSSLLLSSSSSSFSPASSFLSQSSQSEGLSGGNKHSVSLFWIGVVVALAAHVAMAQ